MSKHYSTEGEKPKRGKFNNKTPVVFLMGISTLRKGQPEISSDGPNSDVTVYNLKGDRLYRQAPSYLDHDKRGHLIVKGGQILESYL